MEDKDFKSMMDEHEAGKARGPPSGSHFAKMQNASIWGVKPNFMGEGKDWVMPENIPEAKENNEHIEKKDTIQEAKPAETTSTTTPAAVSPMEGVGNLTPKRASAFGTELRPFKDMMPSEKTQQHGGEGKPFLGKDTPSPFGVTQQTSKEREDVLAKYPQLRGTR